MPAAISLEGLEGLVVIVLHEVLVEDADESLLLLRGRIEGEVGLDDLFWVDWG